MAVGRWQSRTRVSVSGGVGRAFRTPSMGRTGLWRTTSTTTCRSAAHSPSNPPPCCSLHTKEMNATVVSSTYTCHVFEGARRRRHQRDECNRCLHPPTQSCHPCAGARRRWCDLHARAAGQPPVLEHLEHQCGAGPVNAGPELDPRRPQQQTATAAAAERTLDPAAPKEMVRPCLNLPAMASL